MKDVTSDDRANDFGHVGHSLQNAAYPVGGGVHGGLHPIELNNWFAVAGDAFRCGRESPRRSQAVTG